MVAGTFGRALLDQRRDRAVAKRACVEPRKLRAACGDRLVQPALHAPGEGRAAPLHARVEVGIAAAEEVEPLVQPRIADAPQQIGADQHVAAGIEDRHAPRRRVGRAEDGVVGHTLIRAVLEDGPLRRAHHVRAGRAHGLEHRGDPAGSCDLVVVDDEDVVEMRVARERGVPAGIVRGAIAPPVRQHDGGGNVVVGEEGLRRRGPFRTLRLVLHDHDGERHGRDLLDDASQRLHHLFRAAKGGKRDGEAGEGGVMVAGPCDLDRAGFRLPARDGCARGLVSPCRARVHEARSHDPLNEACTSAAS